MSSRIVLPGDGPEAGPVLWRLVGAAAPAPQSTKEPAPDNSVQLVHLEAQYQQKVREAHAAGVHEGEISGRNRAGAEMQPVMERLTRSIQEVANMRARLRHEAEAD